MNNLIKFSSRTPRYIGLDYLQSNGGEYINTNFIPDNKSKFVLDVQFTSTPSSSLYCNGIAGGMGGSNSRFLIAYENTSTNVNSWYFGISDSNIYKSDLGDTNRHTLFIDLLNGSYGVDSTVWSKSGSSFYTTYPVILFARYDSYIHNFSYQKLYSCQLYTNGVLSRDYIPTKRYSDDVLGLYDKVEDRFYENAGTGAFIAGKENAKNNIY